jgi:hypothetical protein
MVKKEHPMCKKKIFYLGLLIGLVVIAFLIFPGELSPLSEVLQPDHGPVSSAMRICIFCMTPGIGLHP